MCHLPPCVGIRVIDFYSFEIRRPVKASHSHQLTVHHSQAHLQTSIYFSPKLIKMYSVL